MRKNNGRAKRTGGKGGVSRAEHTPEVRVALGWRRGGRGGGKESYEYAMEHTPKLGQQEAGEARVRAATGWRRGGRGGGEDSYEYAMEHIPEVRTAAGGGDGGREGQGRREKGEGRREHSALRQLALL